MAQEGPMLASLRRLIDDLGPEEVAALPVPPLPVRLWTGAEHSRLQVDLLLALDEKDRDASERMLPDLRERGFTATRWTGRTVAGYASVNDLWLLLESQADIVVETAAVVRPELDASVPEAWHAPTPRVGGTQTGKGVIVGLVDTGLFLMHPSFRTMDGSTRVLKMWDQTVRGPTGPPSGYGSDTEWDSGDINAGMHSGMGLPPSWLDPFGHGTAVAGVAAGNGQAAPRGRYVGVAPEADLVVVALEARRNAFASTNNVSDAVEYIFGVAAETGRRAVVNLSQGVQIGPHVPLDDVESDLTALLEADDDRIVVVSAGNVGAARAHARASVRDGQTVDLPFDVPRAAGPAVLADVWYDTPDRLEIEVIEPGGQSSPRVDGYGRDVGAVGPDIYEIDCVPNVRHVRANRIKVLIRTADRRGTVKPGTWYLRLHGLHMPSHAPVDVWLDRGMLGPSPRFDPKVVEEECTITSPATADGVLAVGSYEMSPSVGPLAGSSSWGPDRRGHDPAMLAAPGELITTCAAVTAAKQHTSTMGTSLAAAHVTGAIALLLEANPSITRAEVIDCLLRTARTDADTAAGPAAGWGAGKLDIAEALRCATA